MKLVLDTNGSVSGIFYKGPPGDILHAWARGRLQLVATPDILDEYRRVTAELHVKFPGVDIGRILDLVMVRAVICAPARLSRPVCTDPDDDKFFACALGGGARVIVSGDGHLLKASGYRGITVMTPRSFADRHLKG